MLESPIGPIGLIIPIRGKEWLRERVQGGEELRAVEEAHADLAVVSALANVKHLVVLCLSQGGGEAGLPVRHLDAVIGRGLVVEVL